MKKFYVMAALVVVLLAAGNVHAQRMVYASYDPEIFTGGISKKLHGVTFGYLKDFEFSRELHVAVGAQYRMNVKYYTENGVDMNDQLMIIDVPVLLNYPIEIDGDVSFVPFGGPMASLAIAGYTAVGKTTVQWYDENSKLKRFNLYAVLGGDFCFEQFQLFGGVRLGLLDLSTSDLFMIKTKGFFVGIGLNF